MSHLPAALLLVGGILLAAAGLRGVARASLWMTLQPRDWLSSHVHYRHDRALAWRSWWRGVRRRLQVPRDVWRWRP